MKKTATACCALAQLSGVDNETPMRDLIAELTKLKIEGARSFTPGDDSGKGQKCIFVVSTPAEDQLRANLEVLGFVKVHRFERRVGYPTGMLTMHVINL